MVEIKNEKYIDVRDNLASTLGFRGSYHAG